MSWELLLEFAAYGGLGILSLALWWIIYDRVLTPGLSLREALFGRRPNPAVALDVAGGLLALGLLNWQIISAPSLGALWVDLEATALTLLGTVVLLGLLRLGIAGGLRAWFRRQRDAQGDLVTINNELFRQRNLATGLFSTALYLILVAGLVEEDLLNLDGYRLLATFNMLGTWLLGALVLLLHSWLYLGLGGRQHILHESFHSNNAAAPASLLGLLGGMLLLNHRLLQLLEWEQHMFNVPLLWVFLLGALLVALVLRSVVAALLWPLGVRLRHELLTRGNIAWGIIDAALIFGFLLLVLALVG